jgi:hypothetical protein
MKAFADCELGPEALNPAGQAATAAWVAARFVACIATLLA